MFPEIVHTHTEPMGSLKWQDLVHLLPKGERLVLLSDKAASHDARSRHTIIGVQGQSIDSDQVSMQQLEKALHCSHQNKPAKHPLLTGLALGYFCYEAHDATPQGSRTNEPLKLPVFRFKFLESYFLIDHSTQKLHLAASTNDGIRELIHLVNKARENPHLCQYVNNKAQINLRSTMTKEAYIKSIAKVQEWIRCGESYQINLSQKLDFAWHQDPFETFVHLSTLNPTPFAAYIDLPNDQAILSCSPERLLCLQGGDLSSRPIAGTRRGRNSKDLARFTTELIHDTKERAEHTMLVDLVRNDIGRVAETGSVSVPMFCKPHFYKGVIHLESEVTGRKKDTCSALECFLSAFPGGTITGAPKKRTIELLEELEPCKRGIYTGSIGYFTAQGGMDFNIAIRTLFYSNQSLSLSVGGGVTFDANPELEYQETLNKAWPILQALGVDGNLISN